MHPDEAYQQPPQQPPKDRHQELQDDLGMYIPREWTDNVPYKKAEEVKQQVNNDGN